MFVCFSLTFSKVTVTYIGLVILGLFLWVLTEPVQHSLREHFLKS